ncbi:MAG: DUF2505 domain-containing protein [Cellulomonadaceae bacterium]
MPTPTWGDRLGVEGAPAAGPTRRRDVTVHLTSEHHLPASPGDVTVMFADRAFIEHKSAHSPARIEDVVITGSPDAELTVTVRRSIAAAQIPAQARAFVGERLELRQVEAWSTPSGPGRHGTVVLEVTGVPVRMTGTVSLAPDADGSVLRYDGEIKASIPLFGAAVAQAAASAIHSVLDQEAAAAREWLADR